MTKRTDCCIIGGGIIGLSIDALARFRSRHVWSDAVVAERFHRWHDELHVLEVAVTPLHQPLVLPWRDEYGGCKSWVEIG